MAHVGYEEVETNAQGRVLRVLKHTDPNPRQKHRTEPRRQTPGGGRKKRWAIVVAPW